MSSLQSVLTRINENIKRELTNFVFYDAETGEINKITNAPEETTGLECIEVPHDVVKEIIIGRHKSSEYIVAFDKTTRSVGVKKKEDVVRRLKGFKQILRNTITQDQYDQEIQNQQNEAINEKPIYEGIFVDVWYNDLEHLPGQHVWYNNTVFRIKEHQEKNTAFRKSNADLIVENVKLFDDINKELFFDKNIGAGDIFLDNNKLYMFKQSVVNADTDLMIIQDIKNRKWVVRLSNKVYKSLKELSKSENNYIMSFSITEKNDPNVLYRSLELSVRDLIHSKMVDIPFQYQWEQDNKQVSMFVERYFDSYFYGVLE